VLCKILGLFETESHNRCTGKKVFKQLVRRRKEGREGGREGGEAEGREERGNGKDNDCAFPVLTIPPFPPSLLLPCRW